MWYMIARIPPSMQNILFSTARVALSRLAEPPGSERVSPSWPPLPPFASPVDQHVRVPCVLAFRGRSCDPARYQCLEFAFSIPEPPSRAVISVRPL